MGRCGLRGAVALALVAILGVHTIGCSDEDQVPVQPSAALQNPAPVPVSPVQALRLLEWIYNHRSIEPYRRLLAADFRFHCPNDSTGTEWRGMPWTREDELSFAARFLMGGGGNVQFNLDRNIFVYPDPDHVAWDPTGRWHKSIRSTTTLVITSVDGERHEILGHSSFFLVRGDSAVIAEDLVQQGVKPDSTRWYLRRWDDETGEWCEIRARYR